MDINRKSEASCCWKKRLGNPAPRTKSLISSVQLFREYNLEISIPWIQMAECQKFALIPDLFFLILMRCKCCKIAGNKE